MLEENGAALSHLFLSLLITPLPPLLFLSLLLFRLRPPLTLLFHFLLFLHLCLPLLFLPSLPLFLPFLPLFLFWREWLWERFGELE